MHFNETITDIRPFFAYLLPLPHFATVTVVSAPTSAPAPASEDRSPAPLCIEHRESSPTIETADWEPDFVQQFKRWCKTFGISGKDFVDAMTDEVNYQVTGQLFRRLLRHRQTSTTLFSEGKVRLLGTRITNEGIIAPNLWAIRHPSTAAGQLISLVGRLDGPIHQVAGNVKEATFHLLQGVSIPLRIEEGSSLYSDVGVNDRTSSFIHLKAVTRDRKNLLQLVFTGTSAFEVIETHGGCSWEAIANFNSALNFFSAAKTPTARLEAESGGVVLNHGTNVAAEAFWHQFGLSRT